MSTATKRSYTATGIVRLERDLPLEAIGTALMDSAADVDENSAVSIDGGRSLIEIEVMVLGADEPDALSNAKLLINQICEAADFPVDFAEDRKPCPSEWHLVDDAALPPLLARA